MVEAAVVSLESPKIVKETLSPLEQEIATKEQELGIENPLLKTIEASLLVDYKFIQVAVIRGDKKVERTFGDKAWLDWLNGRSFAKTHIGQPLTPEFVLELHKRLSTQSFPGIGGEIRDGIMIGKDYKIDESKADVVVDGKKYTVKGKPIHLSEAQKAAIIANPLLDFIQTSDEKNTGLVVYPNNTIPVENLNLSEEAKEKYEQTDKSTKALLEVMLEDICSWYNTEKAKPETDPHALAAKLQRKIASTHLFRDINGRLSRALMNWTLESANLPPAILEEPSDDIFTDDESWTEKVKEGTERYTQSEKKAKLLAKAEIKNKAELLGLSELKTFYALIYSKIGSVPEHLEEDTIDHTPYNQFVTDFVTEFTRFKEQYSAQRPIGMPDGHIFNLTQGGFVPQFYIEAVRNGMDADPKVIDLIKDSYYQKDAVFRGGKSPDNVTEQDLIRFFSEPIGVGSDYKSLGRRRMSPMSTAAMDRETVAKTLTWHNQLIANAYLAKYHPEALTTTQQSTPISTLVDKHIHNGGGRYGSPFASTSLKYSESKKWANSNLTGHTVTSGILFELHPPTFGGVCTFGTAESANSDIPTINARFTHAHEREVLIPGGVLPGMIEAITIFKNIGTTELKEQFHARRFQSQDVQCIAVKDSTYLKEEVKVYIYRPYLKGYYLTTDTTLIAEAKAVLEFGAKTTQRGTTTPVLSDTPTYHFLDQKSPDYQPYKSPFKPLIEEEGKIYEKTSYADNSENPFLNVSFDPTKNYKHSTNPFAVNAPSQDIKNEYAEMSPALAAYLQGLKAKSYDQTETNINPFGLTETAAILAAYQNSKKAPQILSNFYGKTIPTFETNFEDKNPQPELTLFHSKYISETLKENQEEPHTSGIGVESKNITLNKVGNEEIKYQDTPPNKDFHDLVKQVTLPPTLHFKYFIK